VRWFSPRRLSSLLRKQGNFKCMARAAISCFPSRAALKQDASPLGL